MAGRLSPQRLRCEYRVEPRGVDATQPELSWIVVADKRAQVQSAYRVLVASSADKLAANDGDLWDSGQVASDATYGIRYAGRPLVSHQQCFWKVQTWDGAGNLGPWSESALWTVGILDADEWTGQWIGSDKGRPVAGEPVDFGAAKWIWHAADPEHPPRGRRLFVHSWNMPEGEPVTHGVLTVAADDFSTVRVNGKEVAFTRNLRTPCRVDVRSYVKPGANEVRLIASNGAGPAGVIVRIVAETADGTVTECVTNSDWRSAPADGPDGTTRPADDFALVRVFGTVASDAWATLTLHAEATVPPACLRNDFTAAKPVRRAIAYLAALGWADLYLNGQLVNEDYFSSGWTDYSKRVYYRAYEVTDTVRRGKNALGIMLADGWYSGHIGWDGDRDHHGAKPRVRAMVRVEYEDGSTATFATDESWRLAEGPTAVADILIGEEYDARIAEPWTAPASGGAVDTGTELATSLQWHPGPPVVAVEEFPAQSVAEPAPGVFVFDVGQNFAGVCRLKIRGRAGQQVQLRFGERLNDDGTLYVANMRSARVTDRYTCRGEGEETWTPRNTFHGYQYVEVTGIKAPPSLDMVTGVALSSATPIAADFECSDPTLNQLHNNVYWTQRANFIDVPTDCPQRDERMGWTGDAQVYVNTACMNCDVQAFFRKWLIDLVDAQRADGQFPKIAPVVIGQDDGGPAWADAGVICPWTIYEVYGDRELLAEQYPAMKRFVDFCRARSRDGVLPPDRYHCFGDWLSIRADTPKDVIYTAYFANAARIVAMAARELGEEADAAQYQGYYNEIKAAFNKEFVADDGTVRGDTQCGYVLALAYDLLDGERAAQAKQHLVDDIRERGWHLSTGFIGTKDLMLVLSKIGRADVAFKLLHQESFPGWGFSIKHGATSIWERWDGWTPERGFQDVGMNSFAHYSFGAVYGWMVENLGGIVRQGVGYQRFAIRPQFDPALDHCRVKYDSIRGPIETQWRRDGEQIELRCVVPANTTSTLQLPGVDASQMLVDGRSLRESGLIVVEVPAAETAAGPTASLLSVEVPSGEYRFRFPASK